jgi:hypothetical protein
MAMGKRKRHAKQTSMWVLLPDCKPGQRFGRLDPKKDWDAVLIVLLDDHFEATGKRTRASTKRGTRPAARRRHGRR